jgi:DNA mismatch endonuclease (patch repair protein)
MARVKSRDTKPEVTLRVLVRELGHRYRKNRKDVIGRPDLAFVGRRRAIFLHGCFWHRHDCPSGRRIPKSRIDFWTAKFERNIERDAQVLRELRRAGWRALVIWECELRKPSLVARRVERFLDA